MSRWSYTSSLNNVLTNRDKQNVLLLNDMNQDSPTINNNDDVNENLSTINNTEVNQNLSTINDNNNDNDDIQGKYLRAKLRFFLMAPCWKWHLKRQYPWKAWFQFIKIVILTTQV